MDSSCAGGSTSQFSKLLCEVSYFFLKTRLFRDFPLICLSFHKLFGHEKLHHYPYDLTLKRPMVQLHPKVLTSLSHT